MKMVFRRRITKRTNELLREKRSVTGLKDEEIIEKAVEEVAVENLLWIKRINNNYKR